MKISFITSNKHKYQEASSILKSHKILHKDLGYPEIQSDNLEEVAKFGMNHIKNNYQLEEPFFLEDAGLFIEDLNGFPGVYSSYVFSTLGNEGILKLLENGGEEAYFKSVTAFYDEKIHIFTGKVRGSINEEQVGKRGFGFDPIFVPHSRELTFGLMDPREKNKLSHRTKSLEKLKKFLE